MRLDNAYLTTLSLLIFHQIDAAYWQEWQMFHLPGGIQGYLVFNIAVLPFLLIGYANVIKGHKSGFLCSYICAGLGVLTGLIHATFALFESQRFNLPLSMLIIMLCLVSGMIQLAVTWRHAGSKT